MSTGTVLGSKGSNTVIQYYVFNIFMFPLNKFILTVDWDSMYNILMCFEIDSGCECNIVENYY